MKDCEGGIRRGKVALRGGSNERVFLALVESVRLL